MQSFLLFSAATSESLIAVCRTNISVSNRLVVTGTSPKIDFVHHSMGEDEEGAVEGLMLLWRRLNAEVQRMQASPAARLLDDVLQAMDPASGLTLQDRQQVLPTSYRQQLSVFGVALHGQTGCRTLRV